MTDTEKITLDYDQEKCPECDTCLTYEVNEVYCVGCGLSA